VIKNKDKRFKVSWKTWEGRKSETVSYKDFYKKYSHLCDPYGKYIKELTDIDNVGSTFSFYEEEGRATIKRVN